MSIIPLNLPGIVKVMGQLHDRSDRAHLMQDMIQIALPGEIFIDVGWYPDKNPSGRYKLMVFKNDPDTLLEPIFSSRSVDEVKTEILRQVRRHLSSTRNVGLANHATLSFRTYYGIVRTVRTVAGPAGSTEATKEVFAQ